MTEVPEYLLRRSRERREALGLAPEGGGAPEGGDTPAAPAAEAEESAPAAAEAPVPAAQAEAPVAAATATEELPSYIEPAAPRSGVPVWMMPVLVVLPLWAIIYVGAFGTQQATEAGPPNGAQVYQSAGCGGCHGPKGEGGVGPKLAGGESKLTFPNEADQIKWVEEGSLTKKGQPYGDPARGKVAASGGMPPFRGQLSPEEIKAVVVYERDQL